MVAGEPRHEMKKNELAVRLISVSCVPSFSYPHNIFVFLFKSFHVSCFFGFHWFLETEHHATKSVDKTTGAITPGG